MNYLKYITLGFELFNAVTTLLVMFRHLALLDVAGITINMDLAKAISDNAVAMIKAALPQPAIAQ
jgi:hypothetical protein